MTIFLLIYLLYNKLYNLCSMAKRVIKLSESDIKRIVNESVASVIKETNVAKGLNVYDVIRSLKDLHGKLKSATSEFLGSGDDVVFDVMNAIPDEELSKGFCHTIYEIESNIEELESIINELQIKR